MSNLFNDLMDDWDVYLICRGQRERFIGSRRLEEKDVNCHNCSRLNNTNKLSSKISLEFINSSDYPVLVLIQLDRLEILIVFFFSILFFDVIILLQGHSWSLSVRRGFL